MRLPERSRPSTAEGDALLRLLVENVVDYAIFLLDPDGYITTWNPGAERMKGYAANEIIGKHFSVFYPPDDVAAGKPAWELVEAARDGRFEDEGWRLRKDGTRFWANVVITAVRDRSGALLGFGKVTRDLTTRKQAEETARQLAAEQSARTLAEKTELFQRNLLAIVGHDLRNCLSVILTTGEMIRLHPEDFEKVRRRAGQIITSGRRMAHIVRTIIDYTHTQHHGIPITPKDGADFHAICGRVLQELRIVYPNRQVMYEAEGNPIGEWDEGRLEQVVENLLGNALKFSPDDSTVTLRWSRDAGDDGDLVAIVHNDGTAIAPELLPHVFEAFRSGGNAGSSESRARESMGLGLFIVREIVRAHGGDVGVESEPACGTTFTVRIPARSPVPARL